MTIRRVACVSTGVYIVHSDEQRMGARLPYSEGGLFSRTTISCERPLEQKKGFVFGATITKLDGETYGRLLLGTDERVEVGRAGASDGAVVGLGTQLRWAGHWSTRLPLG